MNSSRASRLTGRLFYCLISLLLAVRLAHAGGPATTTISDIVYRGDGTPAAGTLLVNWPAFISADAHSVAAGSMNLTIGAAGAISVALVPNVGGDPAGTYYTVVYQLSDGTSSTEYWSVPATSPTTIAAVRTVVAPPMVASQFVTKTYVDALPYAGTGVCNPSQYVYSDDERSSPACRGVGAQRFADQYANIQAAITDAGSSGSVVIPASYIGADSYTNPNNINIVDLRGKPDRYKGFVNVVTDCGAKGDGATDDYNAIQSCLNSNPGRHIFFPKMCGSQSGGGSISCIDYKSSHSILLTGNGQWLDGEIPDTWQGAPNIWFSNPASTGFIATTADYGIKITNLEISGPGFPSSCNNSSNPSSWSGGVSTQDLIYLGGGEPTLENLVVQCSLRHGVNVDGSQNGQQPDHWDFKNVQSDDNGGDGFFIHGGDSQAGVGMLLNCYSNGGWCIRDNSSGGGGNDYLMPHTNANHRSPGTSRGSTVNISSISSTANVVTVTTATNHGFAVGNWVFQSGITDATFDGVYQITSVPSGATYTYNAVGANRSSSAGTTQTEGSSNIYANANRTFQLCSLTSGTNNLVCADGDFYDDHQPGAAITIAGAGIAGANLTTTINSGLTGVLNGYGAFLTVNASTTVTNVWATVGGGWGGGPYNSSVGLFLNPYMEANQPNSNFGAGALVLAGDSGPNQMNFAYNGVPEGIFGGTAPAIYTPGTALINPSDTALINDWQAGVTADQNEEIAFLGHSGSLLYRFGYSKTYGMFELTDLAAGAPGVPLEFDAHGSTWITASNPANSINLQALNSTTGNVNFFSTNGCTLNVGAAVVHNAGLCVGDNAASHPQLTLSTSSQYAEFWTPAFNEIAFGYTAAQSTVPAAKLVDIPLSGNTAFANALSVAGGSIQFAEVAAPAGSAGNDLLFADSTAHRLKMNNNNGGAVQVVASGVDINAADQVTSTHLSAALPLAQGGTGVTAAQGSGTKVQLSTGTTTLNDCVKFDASGNTVDAGAACGSGSGGSGTVNSGTANQIAYYAATGTAVSGDAHLTDNATNLAFGEATLAVTGCGSSPGYSFTGLASDGLCSSAAHQIGLDINGTTNFIFDGDEEIANGRHLYWSSTSNPEAATSAGLGTTTTNPNVLSLTHGALEYKEQTLTDAGSLTIDFGAISGTGNVFYSKLTTNTTLAVNNPMAGLQVTFIWCQDATGSRTLAYPASFHGATAIGATASKCTSQQFTYDTNNSAWYAVAAAVTNE